MIPTKRQYLVPERVFAWTLTTYPLELEKKSSSNSYDGCNAARAFLMHELNAYVRVYFGSYSYNYEGLPPGFWVTS